MVSRRFVSLNIEVFQTNTDTGKLEAQMDSYVVLRWETGSDGVVQW
ncbi:hypothetical protein A2U01_0081543, partial [Trifolium medium]|nr:hypothetical protein [Trifolium medium]